MRSRNRIRVDEATQDKWWDVDEQDEEIKSLEDTSVFDGEITDKDSKIELKVSSNSFKTPVISLET